MNALWENELEEAEGLRESAPEGFRLQDMGGLTWAFRKLSALSKKMDEINALADAEIRRIEEWRKGELKKIEDDWNWFQFLITQYAREQRANDAKWRGKTPYGEVKFSKPTPKWIWPDPVTEEYDMLVDWLSERYPDFIRIKKEPAKVEVKKKLIADEKGRVHDPETGELVPGVRVEIPAEEAVAIKVVR